MTLRILLVEDEAICATVEKELFESLNCEVTVAESGEDALKLVADAMIYKQPFDAIVMDIGLPKMNGIETCATLRSYESQNHTKPIPIIAVAAHTDPNILEQCRAAGMPNLMAKPFLKETAAEFLDKCHLLHP